jgi:hypothetical protein
MDRWNRGALLVMVGAGVLLLSCATWQEMSGDDGNLLITPQEVNSLAALKPVPVQGHDYLLSKSSAGGEQTWTFSEMLNGPGGRRVRCSCGFVVTRTPERAAVMMSGTGALERVTPQEERLTGLGPVYGAGRAFGVQSSDGLTLMLTRGRVYYHFEIEGQPVKEEAVRAALKQKLDAVTARFAGTAVRS